MLNRLSTATLLALSILSIQSTPSPTPTPQPKVNPGLIKAFGNYGAWWTALTDEGKENFIDGYRTAMENAQFITHGECMQETKSLKPGAEFNARMQEIMILCELAEGFDFKADQSLKPPLDAFYKEPLNTRIPVFMAMQYVRDEMMGKKTPGQLLDELNEWRKIMNGKSQ